jgi:hypothetical protein
MILRRLLEIIYGFVLVFLTGGTLIFTLFVTPVLFHSLGKEKAGPIVGVLFPPYFHLLFTFSIVALAIRAALLALKPGEGRKTLSIWAGISVATGYLALSLGPRAMAARDAWLAQPSNAPLKAAFDLLHQKSVLINGFVLAGYLALTLLLLSGLRSIPEGTPPSRLPSETASPG